jgi:hypothetical protein
MKVQVVVKVWKKACNSDIDSGGFKDAPDSLGYWNFNILHYFPDNWHKYLYFLTLGMLGTKVNWALF